MFLPQTAIKVHVLETEKPPESAARTPVFAMVTPHVPYINLLRADGKCVPLPHPLSSLWSSGHTFQLESSVLKL